MPDTRLQGTDENMFAAGGLKSQVIEPMKKWRISYSGKMRLFVFVNVGFDF